MKNDKNIQKYSKDKLIKKVADDTCIDVLEVKNVVESLENVIFKTLRSTNIDKNVSIKLFDGFYIESTYMPEKKKTNNLTGKVINVSNKIKLKARITRGYADKINE